MMHAQVLDLSPIRRMSRDTHNGNVPDTDNSCVENFCTFEVHTVCVKLRAKVIEATPAKAIVSEIKILCWCCRS
jgi:hypothetical protein